MNATNRLAMAARFAVVTLPLIVGGTVLYLLISSTRCCMQGRFELFNAYTWPVHVSLSSNLSLVLMIGMIAHICIIAGGSIIFLFDVFSYYRISKKGTIESWYIAGCIAIIFLTVISQILMLFAFFFINRFSIESGPEMELQLLFTVDGAVLTFFIMFFIADIFFLLACLRMCKYANCDQDDMERVQSKRHFLVSLILYVDVPVLIGAAAVAFLSTQLVEISKHAERSVGTSVTDFTRMARHAFVEHDNLPPVVRDGTREQAKKHEAAAAFINQRLFDRYLLGLFSGALLFQVLYSQLVLVFLNFRAISRRQLTLGLSPRSTGEIDLAVDPPVPLR